MIDKIRRIITEITLRIMLGEESNVDIDHSGFNKERKKYEGLQHKLYELLKEYEFNVPDKFRTPRYSNGVEKDGVEITARIWPGELNVRVCVPVDARPDNLFEVLEYEDKRYLTAKEDLVIKEEKDIEKIVERVLVLCKHGKSIFYCNKDKALPLF